jgi:hypothetical protein
MSHSSRPAQAATPQALRARILAEIAVAQTLVCSTRGDYYNDENHAVCLDWRSALRADPVERDYDASRRARYASVPSTTCGWHSQTKPAASAPITNGCLRRWRTCCIALGENGSEYEDRFRRLQPPPEEWAMRTFNNGKSKALDIATRGRRAPASPS